jgi:hypothetical protein
VLPGRRGRLLIAVLALRTGGISHMQLCLTVDSDKTMHPVPIEHFPVRQHNWLGLGIRPSKIASRRKVMIRLASGY